LNADNRKKVLGAARNAVKSGADRRSELLEYFWHRSLGDICLQLGEVVVPEKAANEYCTIIFGSGADMFCVR
jgi:hypothetical protein